MKLVALARHLVVPVAFLALGLELAPALRGEHDAPRVVTAPVTAAPVTVNRGGLDAESLRRAVRAAVRDELAAHADPTTADAAEAADVATPDDDAPLPPTAAQQDATVRATAAIDRILARGVLAPADRFDLEGELAAVHPEDADALRLRLVQAINRDQLRTARRL